MNVGNADELLSAQLGLKHCKRAAIAFGAGSAALVAAIMLYGLLLMLALALLFYALIEGGLGYLCCLSVSNQTGRRFMQMSALSALTALGCIFFFLFSGLGLGEQTRIFVSSIFTVSSVMAVALFLMFLLRLATVVGSAGLTGKAFVLLGLFLMTLGATTSQPGLWVALFPGLLGCLYLVVVLSGLQKAVDAARP